MASKIIKGSFSQRNIEWRRKTFDLIKKRRRGGRKPIITFT